jgi:hypothetical protein
VRLEVGITKQKERKRGAAAHECVSIDELLLVRSLERGSRLEKHELACYLNAHIISGSGV